MHGTRKTEINENSKSKIVIKFVKLILHGTEPKSGQRTGSLSNSKNQISKVIQTFTKSVIKKFVKRKREDGVCMCVERKFLRLIGI